MAPIKRLRVTCGAVIKPYRKYYGGLVNGLGV